MNKLEQMLSDWKADIEHLQSTGYEIGSYKGKYIESNLRLLACIDLLVNQRNVWLVLAFGESGSEDMIDYDNSFVIKELSAEERG